MGKKVRTPSGRVAIQEKRKKVQFTKCSNCKRQLHGVPRLNAMHIRKLAKTELKSSRPYGGNMCADCTREIFRERARNI